MENRGNSEYLPDISWSYLNSFLIMSLRVVRNGICNLPEKFNGLILLYCLTYTSISRVSGAYDHKMQKGKVLDF